MNAKTLCNAALCFLLFAYCATLHAQNEPEATRRSALMVGGSASFSSQGGDLYEGFEGDRLVTIDLVPSALYFAANGLGVGADFSFSRVSQGDNSVSVTGVGPRAGYFFESENNWIPFFAGAVNLLSISGELGGESDSETGLRLKLMAGVLLRKGHLGVSFEAHYYYDRFKPEGFEDAITGDTLLLGIGLAGFFY